jgi:hypothetical protein
MKAALALQKHDEAGVRTILAAAAEIGITDPLQVDALINAVHVATGIGKTPIKAAWKAFVAKAAEAKKKAEAEERKRRDSDFARARQQAMAAERQRLWESCSKIAESPDLLAAMEAIAHELLGVVNEGPAVRATYLTGTSRLLFNKAVRFLRTGASASGKNFPIEQTLKFFPESSVIAVSGASPKSLVYEGEDDPYALQHMLAYVPEAVILSGKKAGDSVNGYAVMFRTLLSEGNITYKSVNKNPATGKFVTVTVIKHGPIAAILTTADDVDQQLGTRCLIQGADESGEQTEAIVERTLSDDDEDMPRNLQPWIDFQLLLKMDMPPQGYRARIPFRKAVLAAFKQSRPKFLKNANMRMRRDVDSFLVAVKASALVHKFQREIAEDGAIIAVIDDYRHAYEAFDRGLAVAHGHIDENVIAVVEAVEQMRDEAPKSDLDPESESPERPVKVSVREQAPAHRLDLDRQGALGRGGERLGARIRRCVAWRPGQAALFPGGEIFG